jgi:hypothetical protein
MPTPVSDQTIRPKKALRPGCDLLSDWLIRKKLSPSAFAPQIGIDQSALSKLLLADRKPSLGTALAIEKLTKGAVPAKSWLVPVEPKPRRPRFRRSGKAA